MAYKSLYRAYRPQVFDDVSGQEAIITTLKHAVEENKIGHAYLFCGPRGTGKTTVAKIFAKAVKLLKMAHIQMLLKLMLPAIMVLNKSEI